MIDMMPAPDMRVGAPWFPPTVIAVDHCDTDPLDPHASPCVRTTWSDGLSTYVWLTRSQLLHYLAHRQPKWGTR